MVKVSDLYVQRGSFTLKKLSFEVKTNNYFVILGRTGSGKTMLLESLAGVMKVQGSILFDDKEMIHLSPEKRGVGFVYQDFVLFPNLSVEKNIKFAERYKKIEDAKVLYEDIVTFLEIKSLLGRDVKHLSGGEKQRVAIARAIYSRPKLLLLDEPLSAVDPTFRNSIMKSLKGIVKRYDTTIIHVTHNFREASFLADEIAVMIDGSILQVGDAHEVLNHPKSMEVAKFLGYKNIFPSQMLEEGHKKKFFSIDPSVILFSHHQSQTEYCFSCKIEEIMGVTDHHKVFAKVNDVTFFAKISNIMLDKLDLQEGMECYLCIHKQEVIFI